MSFLDDALSAATGGTLGGSGGAQKVWGGGAMGNILGKVSRGALNPMAVIPNAISRNTGGSGNFAQDLGIGGALGGMLGGTSAGDVRNRILAAGLVAGAAPLGGVGGTGAAGAGTAGATGAGAAGAGGALGTGLTAGQLGLGLGGIGAGLYGAKTQSDAAQRAADISAAATQGTNALQAAMFNQSQANQQPWLQAGTAALAKQQELLTNPASYQQDPYNAWLQQQGMQGIERSAAKNQMLNSGNVLAELSKYNQGMAGQGFGDQYNRWAGLSGTGQTQANQMAGQASQYAQNVGNLNMQNAANQANAGLAGAANQNALIGSLLNTGAGLYGMYNQNQQNNALMNYLSQRGNA